MEYRLDELGLVKRGRSKHRPRNAPELYDGDYPFVQTGDIKAAGLHLFNYKQTYNEVGLAQSRLWPKGTLCITIAANIAETSILGIDACFPDSVIGFIADKNKCDTRYIKYLFDYRLKSRSQQLSPGATQDNLSEEKLLSLKFSVPSVPVQESIAEKLGRYDALIENNTRRIAILETKAEQLYKECFVRRQSPEHSATTGVTLSLGDAIKISRGLSYTSSEIDTDAGVQLINLKNIQPYGGFRYDGTKRFSGKYKPDQIVVRGDLVMGVTDMTQDRRAVGSVALMPPLKETSVISADLIKIESKIDKLFLYAMFRYGGLSRYISQFANGANVLHLRPQAIMGIKVQLPSKESIERFSARLRPMIALADNLNEQNALLAKERDLLLPRLMSGRLSCAAHESAPSQEEAMP